MLGSNVARKTSCLTVKGTCPSTLAVNAIMWGGEKSQVYFRRGSTCGVMLE